MRTPLPSTGVQNGFSGLLFGLFLFVSLSLSAQTYITTGASGSWEDPAAWNCSGGGCGQNPVPPSTLRNMTVNVNHDIVRSGTNTLTLQRNGRLIVTNATLVIVSRLWLRDRRAYMEANEAEIIIGEGVDLDGMNPSSDLFNIFWNSGRTQLNQACFTLLQGNFYNFFGTLSGTGGVRALDGRLRNIFGNWSRDLVYFASNGTSGVPGSQSTLEEVNAACERCKAGDVAPVLVSDSPTAFCAEELIPSLTTYTNSVAPDGAALIWSTNPDPLVVADHLGQTDVDAPNPGTYYAFFFDAEGNCASHVVSLELIRNTAVAVAVNNAAIGEGESITLTADASGGSGTYTYLWSTGETTESITVNPTSTTDYSVTVADSFQASSGQACSADGIGTITVNPAITVQVNSEAINEGESVTLTANPSGGNGNYSYLWSPGGATTQSITVTPGTTTQFTVTVLDDFQSSTGTTSSGSNSGTVTVNPVIIVEVSGPSAAVNSESINEGESVTLTATPSGGTPPYAYSWSNGETTQSITVSPSVTTEYTVTVNDSFVPTVGDPASEDANGTVTVNPAITVEVDSASICEGEQATLTASPAGGNGNYSYLWSNGETTQSIIVAPDATSDFTVTVGDDFIPTVGAFASTDAIATVDVNPSIGVEVNSEAIYEGETITLTATPSGGNGNYNYVWSNGETTQSIEVSPAETTEFSVTVSDDFGTTSDSTCSGEGVATVTVNPAITVEVNSEAVCEGESVTLTATPSGGNGNYSYSWSNGENTQSITVSPEETTDFTVTVIDDFVTTTETTSSGQGTGTVTVNPAITVEVNNEAIYEGETVTLTATPSGGNGNYSYVWSNGETTQSIEVSLAETTEFSVTVSDDFISSLESTCSGVGAGMVTVNPAITVEVESVSTCEGEEVTLTATPTGGNGNYSYSWSNGDDTQSITVTPEATSDLTVTVIDDFETTTGTTSSGQATATVTVNPSITVEVESLDVCRGESVTLTANASGGDGNFSFIWFDESGTQVGTGASISVSPLTNTEYTVTVNDGFVTSTESTCNAEGSAIVTVENCDLREATEDELVILKHPNKLSNALAILAQTGYDPNNQYNDFLYRIRFVQGVPQVLVQIVVEDGRFNALLAELASLGVQQSDFLQDYDVNNPEAYVSCWITIQNTDALNALDVSPNLVQVLDGRLGLTNTGAVLSEGVAAMRANIARLGWGVTGDGVTIGVISDSFDNNNGYGSDQLGGDLPGPNNPNPDQLTAVDVLEDLDEGGSDEGRAMLQLIHDVAPDATLKFATGFNGKYNAASQIEALRLAGCDIIVDDVQYIDEAFWQDDVWAQAVNNSVAAGVPVFTAAGNFGDKSIEQTFTPDPTNPNFHVWQGAGGGSTEQTLNLDPGFYIISLQWDDDYKSLGQGTGAEVDLNAYLGESPDILDFGSNVINFGKDPMDFLYFLVLNPTTTNLLIERADGSPTTPISFKYVVFRSGDTAAFDASPALGSSTVVGHANAISNFTVGAVRFDRVDPTPIAQQSSSDGGTVTAGNVRSKPDAMGPTGGDTTVPIGPDFDGDGQPNFFGTSAAAPHVAAVAAMLQEAGAKFSVPLTGANSIRNLLLNTAVDMGNPLKSGAGFVRADLALGAIANPVPNLTEIDFEDFLAANPGFVPGQGDFEANFVGQNFTDESVVFFQGQELPTTFVNSETLTATIPAFLGNGESKVFTPSKDGATGDGGESDELGIFDIPPKSVIIKPNDITRFFGTSVNPTDNPELFGFTVLDAETGDPLPQEELDLFLDETLFPVSYSTTDAVDSPTSVTFSVLLNVDLDNVDPGILELYNFDDDGSEDNGEIEAGNLFIEPTHVEISVEYPETLIYGEAFPGIDYIFNYVDDNGNPVPVVQSEKDKYELAHRNAFRLVNSVVVIANGRFRLVNDGTTNRFRLVNCEDPDPAVNRFRLVNGECEPEIVFDETLPDGTANRFRLVNQTFYVSQSVVDESDPLANRFRLVNGDGSDQEWDSGTKIIEIDPDLFANANRFRLVNGRNLTNLFRLVNDNEYDFLQADGTTNRFRLVNGVEFSEGSAFFDGELVNRFRLVNGRSFRLVNEGGTNRFRLVNSDPGQEPFGGDTENSVVLFNSSEGSEVVDSDPIAVFPVNFITGKDVGIQYVGTGRVFNNNFVATSTPVPVEILPAPLEVAIDDLTREYGTIPAQEEFSVDESQLDPQLQYEDTLDDVFPEGLNFELDCEQCDVAGSPHLITASSTTDSGNYDIIFTSGVFNVTPFALTHTMDPATITRGDAGPFEFDYTLSIEDPAWTEADLPYGETREDIFGALAFDPADGCLLPESGEVSVNPIPETPNYDITYVSGPLTVQNPTLQVTVSGTAYIQRRDYAPTSFEVSVEGLVCGDPAPVIENFVVLNASGEEVSGRLNSGVYEVLVDVEGIPGLEQYEVEQQAGELFVNPRVSCRNRIRATGPCRSPASLPEDPRITTKLTYTYENRFDVPIFIPRGHDNYLFGPAHTVGELPEVFLPGVHTFEIFTDGKGVKWAVESPDCWFPDITIWATLAPSCASSLTSKVEEVDSFTREFEDGVPEAYPNPATDYLTLFVGNMEGQLVRVSVFDEAGRLILDREYPIEEGQSEVYMDISAMKEGILTIVTENQGNRSAFRIIKQ